MKLYEAYQLGNISLKNRIVMAPLTRSRAIDNIPNDLMKTYYSQRAGAGLIISEGTSPSVNGLGYPRIPGAFTPAQVEGWADIAEGIHNHGGKFFVQLMHCGRVTAKENLPAEGDTIAPSAVKADGKMYTDEKGEVDHVTPKAMTLEDIINAQREFVDCAENLVRAGIDGIELHAANGYLMEQFLNPKSNLRSDEYGGSFENRTRFVLETVKKVIDAIGAKKVGIRISPYGAMNDVSPYYDDLEELYLYLASELRKLDMCYIHIVDHRKAMGSPDFKTDIKKEIKTYFAGTVITGGDVDSEAKAKAILDDGFDLVYVGRAILANPDFVEKIKRGKTLQEPRPELFYTPGKEGYTDY